MYDESPDATNCPICIADEVLQFWLLGYEFPTTLMLFTLDTLYILTTQKKGSLSTSSIATPDPPLGQC